MNGSLDPKLGLAGHVRVENFPDGLKGALQRFKRLKER